MVTLRYGIAAQPLVGADRVVPIAATVLEFLHFQGSLAHDSEMNLASSAKLSKLAAGVCPEAIMVRAQVHKLTCMSVRCVM